VPRVTPPAPERPPLAELARRAGDLWMAAFKARDVDRVAAIYTEDACVTSPGRPRVCGRGAIAEAARAAWAKLPEARTAWGRTWLRGDLLAVESAWSAEARGAVSLTLCWFSPEGLIREERVYADGRELAAPPAAAATKGRRFDGLPTTREAYESPAAVDEQASTELLRTRFFEPVLADDAELIDFTQPGSFVGKKFAARWTGARSLGLTGARVALTRSWAVESYFFCEYEATGGVPGGKRGETVTLHGVEVLQIDGDRVKRGWRYEDSLERSGASGSPALFPLAVP